MSSQNAEEKIKRMSLAEYRAWSDENWHGTDEQISERAGKLYDRLVEGLHVEVVSSSASSMSAHIMIVANAVRKFPNEIDHAYHFQKTHLPHATHPALTTVVSIEYLDSEFAMILADLVENLL